MSQLVRVSLRVPDLRSTGFLTQARKMFTEAPERGLAGLAPSYSASIDGSRQFLQEQSSKQRHRQSVTIFPYNGLRFKSACRHFLGCCPHEKQNVLVLSLGICCCSMKAVNKYWPLTLQYCKKIKYSETKRFCATFSRFLGSLECSQIPLLSFRLESDNFTKVWKGDILF